MYRRACLVGALVMALVLAACLSGAPAPASDTTSTAPIILHTLVHPTAFQGEPSLAVTQDGTLYTHTRAGIHRSTDAGETWTLLGPATLGGLPGIDPHITADPDGRVWFSSMNSAACLEVDVSDDQGETWRQTPAVCDLTPGDRQYVAALGDGRALLAYHQVPSSTAAVLATADAGASWTTVHRSAPADVVDGTYTGWFGGAAHNPATDVVHFPATVWTECREPHPACAMDPVRSWGPGLVTGTFDGRDWTRHDGPAQQGRPLGVGLVRADADDAGTLWITWASFQDGDVAVWLTSTPDDGRTWTKPLRLDTGPGSEAFPSVSAQREGNVAVAVYAADEAGHPSEIGDDAQWTVQLYELADANAADPGIDATTLSNGTVKQGRIAVGGTAATAEDREFLDYFALDHLPDGRWISIYNTLDPDTGEQHNVFARIEG